jgi:hypothetical protein
LFRLGNKRTQRLPICLQYSVNDDSAEFDLNDDVEDEAEANSENDLFQFKKSKKPRQDVSSTSVCLLSPRQPTHSSTPLALNQNSCMGSRAYNSALFLTRETIKPNYNSKVVDQPGLQQLQNLSLVKFFKQVELENPRKNQNNEQPINDHIESKVESVEILTSMFLIRFCKIEFEELKFKNDSYCY